MKWFNSTKGYGFNAPRHRGNDVFVRLSAAQSTGIKHLRNGQRVSYEVRMGRGMAATTRLELR